MSHATLLNGQPKPDSMLENDIECAIQQAKHIPESLALLEAVEMLFELVKRQRRKESANAS